MISQKIVQIKGKDYILNQFPATKGVRILKELIKIVGTAFADIQEGNGVSVARVMSSIVDNLDKVEVDILLKDMLSGVNDGQSNMPINVDMEFAGRYDALFELVQEVISFNFESVFTLAGLSAA